MTSAVRVRLYTGPGPRYTEAWFDTARDASYLERARAIVHVFVGDHATVAYHAYMMTTTVRAPATPNPNRFVRYAACVCHPSVCDATLYMPRRTRVAGLSWAQLMDAVHQTFRPANAMDLCQKKALLSYVIAYMLANVAELFSERHACGFTLQDVAGHDRDRLGDLQLYDMDDGHDDDDDDDDDTRTGLRPHCTWIGFERLVPRVRDHRQHTLWDEYVYLVQCVYHCCEEQNWPLQTELRDYLRTFVTTALMLSRSGQYVTPVNDASIARLEQSHRYFSEWAHALRTSQNNPSNEFSDLTRAERTTTAVQYAYRQILVSQ